MPLCFMISESSFCEILKTLKNRWPCKLPSGIDGPTTQCKTACSKTNGRTEKVWMWDHPPYGSDLSPYEFLVFGPMKGQLSKREHRADGEGEAATQKWLLDV
ncbi:hypothetical protein TNIN_470181 [Trichonephila inaurata madagascariensis]|uniref:Uncharacterized protein n=1 Tax=Trichonephila inaurata madagascariensis TaxID=2747483 RepID=A0A8X7BTM3_9ARAC|nr:hypothetical protein TNIN_470181 [Trichonephila inaurata madagascariensis]